jgi:hypothetical protein
MTDDPLRNAAIGRLKVRHAFQVDVVSYVIINALLVVVWAVSGAGYFWPIWVMFGWGIGLVLHAWTVFGQKPITELEIEEEMRREQGSPPPVI